MSYLLKLTFLWVQVKQLKLNVNFPVWPRFLLQTCVFVELLLLQVIHRDHCFYEMLLLTVKRSTCHNFFLKMCCKQNGVTLVLNSLWFPGQANLWVFPSNRPTPAHCFQNFLQIKADVPDCGDRWIAGFESNKEFWIILLINFKPKFSHSMVYIAAFFRLNLPRRTDALK